MLHVFRAETQIPTMSTTDETIISITAVKKSKHLGRDVWYAVTEDIRVIINEHNGIQYDKICFSMGVQTFFVHVQMY
jgi:hypothetical protein